MKKKIILLSLVAFGFTATQAIAQDKVAVEKKEQADDNLKKEADALEERIEQYTIKVEANKDNAHMDYEAEKARIAEWTAKWEKMTDKVWAEREEKK